MRANSPAIYEHFAVPAFAHQWATDLVVDHVQPGHHVLDVACGTGIVARCARHRMTYRGRVVGLDNDEAALAIASLCEPASIEWRQADAARMPLREASFDVVLCQQGLQHFARKSQAMAEMRRVLKPGGRLALTVWRSTEFAPPFAAIERVMAEIVRDADFRLPAFAFDRPDEMKRLAEEAGFLEVEVLRETKTTRLEKWKDMIDLSLVAYRGMFGPVTEFDELQRGRFMVAARDALREYEDPDSERVEFPQSAYLLIATAPPATELPEHSSFADPIST